MSVNGIILKKNDHNVLGSRSSLLSLDDFHGDNLLEGMILFFSPS